MDCVDTGDNVAFIQTQPIDGPHGAVAVLKVSSADDHSKDSHQCNADFQLLFTPGGTDAPLVVDLPTTDGDYKRTLSLRLHGFSQDGKRVFGVLSERGSFPSTTLFAYDTQSGKVSLTDLTKQFAHIVTPKCGTTFDVIGTAATDAVVLELHSEKQCAPSARWLLDFTRSGVERLPRGAPIMNLYELKINGP